MCHTQEEAPERSYFIRCQYKFLRQQLCCLQNREASAVRLWLLPHDDKVSVLKTNNLCTNCLTGGHFKRQCKSIHKCKVCQKPHHTLLHVDQQNPARPAGSQPATPVSSNAAMKLKSNALLMTCHVSVIAPDGSPVEARALRFIRIICIRAAGSKSFFTSLHSIGGVSQRAPIQSISNFQISPVGPDKRKIGVTAVVVPRVTCDLPLTPVPFQMNWKHLTRVRRAVVLRALQWLVTHNQYYHSLGVTIDTAALDQLPQDGNISQLVSVTEDTTTDSPSTSATAAADDDLCDEDLPQSFVPVAIPSMTEQETVQQSVQQHQSSKPALMWPSIGGMPLNEFTTEGYFTCAFPTGAGDFLGQRQVPVTTSST